MFDKSKTRPSDFCATQHFGAMADNTDKEKPMSSKKILSHSQIAHNKSLMDSMTTNRRARTKQPAINPLNPELNPI
jgi:hypothetical protein